MADALSRMANSSEKAIYVQENLLKHNLTLVPPVIDYGNFFDPDL